MGQRLEREGTTSADTRLLARIAGRDEAAVGELYDRHGQLVYGLALRILGDCAAAEDVLHEVFLQVWREWRTYNSALGSPTAWLVGIARDRAINRLRDQTGHPAIAPASEPTSVDSAQLNAAVTEPYSLVARALHELPREQRELITAAYFLGLTQSELAERFDLPLPTVKASLRTGMLVLRERLRAAGT